MTIAAAPSGSAEARLRLAQAPQARALRVGAILGLCAALIWPFQAALVAWVLAGLATDVVAGQGLVATGAATGAATTMTLAAVLWAGLGFAALGALQAALESLAAGRLFVAADQVLATERGAVLARAARRGLHAPQHPGSDPESPAAATSAAEAALVVQKLPLLVPALTRYGPARWRVMVMPAVIVMLVLPVSWVVALILLIAGPLIPLFMALVGMAAKEASQRQMVEIGDMNSLLIDRLSALTDIRLMDAGARTLADFAARAEALRMRTMAVLRIAFLSSAVLELFAALGVAMVAVYVGFSLLGTLRFGAWGSGLSLGEGVFVLMLAPEFFRPLRDLAAAWHDRAAALALAEDLRAAEAEDVPQVLGLGAAAARLPGPPRIVLRAVSVTVSGRRIAFPDLDLAPGTRLAVTGPSGVGKSTLLALLAGQIRAETGTIEVAGVTLDEASADGWRAALALVPQAVHFADRAVAEVLDPRGLGEDPARALAAAGARDVVARLPGGLAARLGETGAGLSGGEARRLLVARALLSGAAVILADEPTADLDPETADAVTEGLLSAARAGATLIVATHDPRLVAALGSELRLTSEAVV